MSNALSPVFALPQWYFAGVLAPALDGSLVPIAGVACLVFGTLWGIVRRRLDLVSFLLLPLISEVFVATVPILPASLRSAPLIGIFILLEVLVAIFLIARAQGARPAGIALSVFGLTYAFAAATFTAIGWLPG